MPLAKKNPSKTLDKILKLIDNDLKRIQKSFKDSQVQLDSASAQTLCRYATTLSGIKESKDKDKAKDRIELDKLSTKDLIKQLEEA